MDKYQIYKEIVSAGGIGSVYTSTKELNKMFGGTKRVSNIISAIHCSLNPCNFSGLRDRVKCIYEGIKGWRLKDGLILYISSSAYSKSHATYYAPPMVDIIKEVKEILSENNDAGYIYVGWTSPKYDNGENLSEEDWYKRQAYFNKKVLDVLKSHQVVYELTMEETYGKNVLEALGVKE